MCSRKGVFARWYKTGNCAIEAVDLGRREERMRRSNEGDKRESSSLPPPFSLSSSPSPLSLYLSIFRALPFESPRHRRISTRQRSYSPLESTSSRRAFVAPSSFILASSFERSETETRRTSLSRTSDPVSSTIFTVGSARFFFLHLSFPFLPLSGRNRVHHSFFRSHP